MSNHEYSNKSKLSKHYYNIRAACKNARYDIVKQVSLQILKDYPYDEFALDSYASCLCLEGKLSEAKEILEFLIHNKRPEKVKISLCNLLRIEFQLENFEKAYEYIKQYKLYTGNPNVKYYELFIQYILLNQISPDTPSKWYKYDEDECIRHVINRYNASNGDNTDCFNSDINIRKLFLELQKKIETLPREIAFNAFTTLSYPSFNDLYFLKMPYCGHRLNKDLHYIKIVTIPFSNNIITMSPTQNLPVTHTIYDFEEEEKQKHVKVLTPTSQIEKFNKKWNRK